MTSFLDPEQLGALQQRGLVAPEVAAAMRAKREAALGAMQQMAAEATYQLGGEGVAPQAKASSAPAMPGSQPRPQQRQGGQPSNKQAAETYLAWEGLQKKALRFEPGVAITTQMPIKAGNLPVEARNMMSGRAALGWDPRQLDDNEYVMLLRLVHKNLPNMSQEEQQRVLGEFRSAASERPALIKKLQAMMKAG